MYWWLLSKRLLFYFMTERVEFTSILESPESVFVDSAQIEQIAKKIALLDTGMTFE